MRYAVRLTLAVAPTVVISSLLDRILATLLSEDPAGDVADSPGNELTLWTNIDASSFKDAATSAIERLQRVLQRAVDGQVEDAWPTSVRPVGMELYPADQLENTVEALTASP